MNSGDAPRQGADPARQYGTRTLQSPLPLLALLVVGLGLSPVNGQQWRTQFDGRGFLVAPDGATWRWGLELRGYGWSGPDRTVSAPARVTVADQRVAYDWDETLQEWFVNSAHGLEHGFTVRARPPEAGERLDFVLAVRGNLWPALQPDGTGVRFADGSGTCALLYDGLKVIDAEGRTVPARFSQWSGACPVAPATFLRLSIDDRDARYPLTIDPLAQQAYVKASNTGAQDDFGYAVALSGDTLVVGAFGEASSATGVNGNQGDNSARGSGAVYVFVRDGTNWSQQAYLKASNTGSYDYFGWSLALAGDTLVVGAWQEDSSATGVNGDQSDNSAVDSGAAYVFVRDGTNWSQQAYLKASNAGKYDYFGESVAIAGDTVVVGAFREDSNATGMNGDQSDNSTVDSGAVYAFVRDGTNWTQQAYLKASNPGVYDLFGYSVAVAADTLVVGARTECSSATGVNGNQSDNSATNSGAVYVFVRDGTNWSQQAYIKASNTGAQDYFGEFVALAGDTLVATAPFEDSSATGVNGNQSDNSAGYAGASYVFVRNGTNWSQQAYLKASNTGAGDDFGSGVALHGDTVVIGAIDEDSNATGVNGNQNDNSARSAGAAYVFTRSGTNWSQQAYLKASNTEMWDTFGRSAAIEGDTVVVGALCEGSNATGVNGNQNDNSAASSGAAYVFATPPPGTTVTLTVIAAHGVPIPAVGVHTSEFGASVECTVSGGEASGTTQYLCAGWALAGQADTNGAVSGATTNMTLIHTGSATLTWRWTTNYWLTLNAAGPGNVNRTNGWYALGSNVVVTAAPSNHCHFTGWSGDTQGCVLAGNAITAAMTQARTISANFAEDIGPAWWYARNVLNPSTSTNDYAAANQGQVKWIARQAYLEMQATLTGGAGAAVSNLVAGFTATNNYMTVNVGQVKATAKPFYDRLRQAHPELPYPWTTNTVIDDNDYSIANVGQVKNAFSFAIGN